jgi:hypothetical protein
MTQTTIEAYKPANCPQIKAFNWNCTKENGDKFCIHSTKQQGDYISLPSFPACCWMPLISPAGPVFQENGLIGDKRLTVYTGELSPPLL